MFYPSRIKTQDWQLEAYEYKSRHNSIVRHQRTIDEMENSAKDKSKVLTKRWFMDLKFLGRGSAFNVLEGNTSCYFIEKDELFLIDCGEKMGLGKTDYELIMIS